jgi:hypothetical protein
MPAAAAAEADVVAAVVEVVRHTSTAFRAFLKRRVLLGAIGRLCAGVRRPVRGHSLPEFVELELAVEFLGSPKTLDWDDVKDAATVHTHIARRLSTKGNRNAVQKHPERLRAMLRLEFLHCFFLPTIRCVDLNVDRNSRRPVDQQHSDVFRPQEL